MFNNLAAMWHLTFKRRSRGWTHRVLASLGLAFLLAACAQVAPPVERNFVSNPDDFANVKKVAILPLDNWTNRPNAGEITAQLLASEFYSQALFELAPESDVASAVSDTDNAARDPEALAKALGVDAVLTGSVSEYGYKHTLREEPAVGFNVRLVRGSDGRVIWASSQSEVGDSKRAESVNQLAQRVIQRMVTPLSIQFRAP